MMTRESALDDRTAWTLLRGAADRATRAGSPCARPGRAPAPAARRRGTYRRARRRPARHARAAARQADRAALLVERRRRLRAVRLSGAPAGRRRAPGDGDRSRARRGRRGAGARRGRSVPAASARQPRPASGPTPARSSGAARLLAAAYGRIGTTAMLPGERDLALGLPLLRRLAKRRVCRCSRRTSTAATASGCSTPIGWSTRPA